MSVLRTYMAVLLFLATWSQEVLGQCVVFREDFNLSHQMTFVKYPYGSTPCGYPKYIESSVTNEEFVFIHGCLDESELRKKLDLPMADYTIEFAWSTGVDGFQTVNCAYTFFDSQFGASCIVPNRVLAANRTLIWEKPGQFDGHTETTTVNYRGRLDTLHLGFVSMGWPKEYQTAVDYIEIRAKTPVSANFEASGNCVNTPITFTDLSGSVIKKWEWNFGDGTTLNETTTQNPMHVYKDTGTYQVKLKVTDHCDQTAEISKTVKIQAPKSYSVNAGAACFGLNTEFRIQSVRPLKEWNWSFGNGKFSKDSVGITQYFSTGDFDVLFAGTDMAGCALDTQYTVSVIPPPFGGYTYSQTDNRVEFTSGANQAGNFLWEFGDGDSSSAKHPVHVYKNTGTFQACLSIKNTCGTDKACQDVVVSRVTHTGVDKVFGADFKIWPNPAKERVFVEIPASFRFKDVLDVQGRRISITPLEQGQRVMMDISSLPNGSYEVRIEQHGTGTVASNRFIKSGPSK